MSKKAIRQAYRAKRKKLSASTLRTNNDAITQEVLKFINDGGFQRVHIFKSISYFIEVETDVIINSLLKSNVEVVIPKVVGDEIEHCLINSQTLFERSSWGIEEPKSQYETVRADTCDCVIVPLLAYDKLGYRVGYGGGYYDRFLAEIDSKTPRVGVSFFAPESTPLPVEDYDIPLHAVITPEGFFPFADHS